MTIKVEQYEMTPDGPVAVSDPAETLYDNTFFYDDALYGDDECCAQVSDEIEEAFIEFIGIQGALDEIRLSFPNDYYDIFRGDAEGGATMMSRIVFVGSDKPNGMLQLSRFE